MAKKATVQDIDVAAVRKKIGMTQEEFSKSFAIPLSTLKKWERKERSPTGPALVLLTVISRDPEAVKKALAG